MRTCERAWKNTKSVLGPLRNTGSIQKGPIFFPTCLYPARANALHSGKRSAFVGHDFDNFGACLFPLERQINDAPVSSQHWRDLNLDQSSNFLRILAL
jgi:hypothetical protein